MKRRILTMKLFAMLRCELDNMNIYEEISQLPLSNGGSMADGYIICWEYSYQNFLQPK